MQQFVAQVERRVAEIVAENVLELRHVRRFDAGLRQPLQERHRRSGRDEVRGSVKSGLGSVTDFFGFPVKQDRLGKFAADLVQNISSVLRCTPAQQVPVGLRAAVEDNLKEPDPCLEQLRAGVERPGLADAREAGGAVAQAEETELVDQ